MSAPTTYEIQKLEEAKANGYSFFLVKGDENEPAFVYSVGMAQKNLPDVLMFLDSEYVKPQLGMLTNFLNTMLEGVERFEPEALTKGINGMTKTVTDPEIDYTWEVLTPSETDKAVHDYMCRCHFFRRVLGDPQAVVISSDYNPSWSAVTALATA